MRCVALKQEGFHVRAGGPAVSLIPEILAGVAELGGDVPALVHHNPEATFTTRGCIRRCKFCAVPITEGHFKELKHWERKPIVCDNNILASSNRHFDKVIDSLKTIQGIDFNQGLDCRLLTIYHADRLAELDLSMVRLAWDYIGEESNVRWAIDKLKRVGIPKSKIRCYVLVGYNDTPADALYRCETLKSWGIGKPNAMHYQPLDCLVKNSFVAPGWTKQELARFCSYWNRQAWLSKVPYKEYRNEDQT